MIRYYDKTNNRLIHVKKRAVANFWDAHWDIENFRKAIMACQNDAFILNTTKMFLKNGKILEGGCGIGSKVYCLHHNGYSAFGVDFATNTVKRINNYFPELNITEGDVRDLKFKDEFFDGYWSLGVIEHFYDGYEDILQEMARVIKKGGHVFVTFPYMSPVRRLKARSGVYQEFKDKKCDLKDFYQFVLDETIVRSDFEKHGFTLKYMKPWDALKCLKDEISIFKPVLQKLYDYKGRNRFINFLKSFLRHRFTLFGGHMILMVFEKVR
jgi:SAM-dependent methyltransferase